LRRRLVGDCSRIARPSVSRQEAHSLGRGDLLAILLPFVAFVPDEVVEAVLPQGFGDQFRGTHEGDGLAEGHGEIGYPGDLPLQVGHRRDVRVGGLGQLVVPFDARQPRAQDDGERQVGVGRAVQAAVLQPGALRLLRTVDGHSDERGLVVRPPAHVGRRLAPSPHALVGIGELAGDGGDLGGVAEQTGQETASCAGQPVLAGRVVEGAALPLEQGDVRVHARARVGDQRLGHEGGVDPALDGDVPHDGAHRHDVVGHRQGVRVPQVYLILPGARLVMGELDGYPHILQGEHGGLAEVLGDGPRHVVEVGAGVDRHGLLVRVALGIEEVELDLGVDVAGEAHVGGLVEGPLEDRARIRAHGLPVAGLDVAYHPRRGELLDPLGKEGERGGVGDHEHVVLVHAGQALDGRSVESDAVVERLLEFGRCDGDRLELPDHVGEPQAHEAHALFLDRSQNVFLLTVHAALLHDAPIVPSRPPGHLPARRIGAPGPAERPPTRKETATRLMVGGRCANRAPAGWCARSCAARSRYRRPPSLAVLCSLTGAGASTHADSRSRACE